MFHKSSFGRYGETLPCDLDGYVAERGDKLPCFRFAYNCEPTNWRKYVSESIKETKLANKRLDEWRNG